MFGAKGENLGVVVALNFVMSGAKAYLDDTDPSDGSMSVGAVGSVSVSAEDKVEIYSNVKLVSSSITTNDGGASILGETVNDFVPADYESSEKVREIDFGDRVRLTDDYPTGDYGTADGEIDLAVGETVKLAGTYAKGGNAGSVYKYIGADGKVDLGDADYSDADLWQEIGGNEGSVYQYMGTTATVDLSVEDYRDLRYWKEVMETQLIPQGNNLTDSDSSSTGGVVSLNQLDSEATAYIENTVVTAHAVSVSALENVTVSATTDGWFQSSGGGLLGNGKSVAEGGAASVNIIFTEAQAWVIDSTLTGRVGDVRVVANLPAYVSWDGNDSTNVGNLFYDSQNHRVSWEVGRLPVSVYEIDASFGISITPGEADVNKILVLSSGSTVSATDTETKDTISKTTKPKTTKLEDDDIASLNNSGRVE